MAERYIHHITLNTGHARASYRSEIHPGVVEILRPLLERALTGEHTPIPGVTPPHTLTGGVCGRCISLTVWAPPLSPLAFPGAASVADRPVPIAEIGIAPHSRCGTRLWRSLHETGERLGGGIATDIERCPPEPWVAAALDAGIAQHMAAAHWLGDFERCLAWAWLEHLERRAWCERCASHVAPILDRGDSLCPHCRLVL